MMLIVLHINTIQKGNQRLQEVCNRRLGPCPSPSLCLGKAHRHAPDDANKPGQIRHYLQALIRFNSLS